MADEDSRDVLGHRAKIGVVVPSTNTVVQPEMEAMRPDGVTNHVSRIRIPNVPIGDDEAFARLIAMIMGAQDEAIDAVMSCEPDHVILGISAETFWDGANKSDELRETLAKRAGVGVTLASDAIAAALARTGARRIGIVTPYQSIGGSKVTRFFGEIGLEVTEVVCLACSSPVATAHVGPDVMERSTRELAMSRPDAVVQIGTNLPFAHLAARLEPELGLPVVCANTALYAHALDALGIPDPVAGFGPILADRRR